MTEKHKPVNPTRRVNDCGVRIQVVEKYSKRLLSKGSSEKKVAGLETLNALCRFGNRDVEVQIKPYYERVS